MYEIRKIHKGHHAPQRSGAERPIAKDDNWPVQQGRQGKQGRQEVLALDVSLRRDFRLFAYSFQGNM